MAKSKLCIQYSHALLAVSGTLVKMQQAKGPLNAQDIDTLGNQFDALSRASSALEQHLDKLDERTKSPKLPDRLRNLKNVFKDKEDLSRQRVAARKWFTDTRNTNSNLWKVSQKVLRTGDTSKVKNAVRECLDKIRHLEADLPGLDRKVDALDAALEA